MSLVLIQVDGGIVGDVDTDDDHVDYCIVDWDAQKVGEPIEELEPAFAKQWPEVAQAIIDYNKSLEE